MTMPGTKEKLIALVDDYTDPLSVKDIHKADFAEKFTDHLLASSPIQELWNEAYDLGVDSALHNHFGLSWEDAAGLRKEIKQLQDAVRWIPVAEKLPEEHDSIWATLYGTKSWQPGLFRKCSDTVIACAERKDGRKRVVAIGRYDGRWDWHKLQDNEQVTHWMPLPQPPKGE